MILGLDRVIRGHEAEVGRFYLEPVYDGEPRLFQCVVAGKVVDGEAVKQALYFVPQEQPSIVLADFPWTDSIVALPDVHVRVDPPSIAGSSSISSLSGGMFFIMGDEAFVTAGMGFRWRMMNVSTGKAVEGAHPTSWVSFSRWLLVVQESGEEIPIASFGE